MNVKKGLRRMTKTAKAAELHDGFEEQRSVFEQLAPNLSDPYEDSYVAIHGGEVVDSDADFQTLVARFFEAYGDAAVYIGYVGSKPPVVRIPSPSGQV